MAMPKAAFVIRTSELCTEKFTKKDYDHLGTIVQAIYKMFGELDIKNNQEAREVVETCLELENQSTDSKYYYWFAGSSDFSIKKSRGDNYNIMASSSAHFNKEDLNFIKMASESILDSDQFEGQDNIDVFVLDIDVIKRRVPIIAYYKDEPYVMK